MTDLTVVGSFKLPNGGDWGYSSGAMAYDPDGDSSAGSIYFAAFNNGGNKGAVGEFTIPTPIDTSSLGAMNYATSIQGIVDATEGGLYQCRGLSLGNSSNIRGLAIRSSQLYMNCAASYDDNRDQPGSFFIRPKNLSTTGSLTGPFATTQPFQGYTAGYLAEVPSSRQAAFGGDVITGLWAESILTRESEGPAAFSLTLASVGASPVTATALVFYPDPNLLTPNAAYNYALSGAQSAFIPVGYDTVAFFGGKGQGTPCYGRNTDDPLLAFTVDPEDSGRVLCYDPEEISSGWHAYPYKAMYWLYRISDLMAAKAGSVTTYSLNPYAYGDIASFIPNFDALYAGKPGIIGATYDPVGKRLFLAAQKQNSAEPLIYVLTHP